MTVNKSMFIPISEAAKSLGCSRRTVYRHIESGLIPVVDVDGRKKVRRSDIEGVANCTVEKAVGILENFINLFKVSSSTPFAEFIESANANLSSANEFIKAYRMTQETGE